MCDNIFIYYASPTASAAYTALASRDHAVGLPVNVLFAEIIG